MQEWHWPPLEICPFCRKHSYKRLLVPNQKWLHAPDRHTPRECLAGRLISIDRRCGLSLRWFAFVTVISSWAKCVDPASLWGRQGWVVRTVNSDACAHSTSNPTSVQLDTGASLPEALRPLLRTSKLPTQVLFYCIPATFTQASVLPLFQTHWSALFPTLTPLSSRSFPPPRKQGGSHSGQAGNGIADHLPWHDTESDKNQLQVYQAQHSLEQWGQSQCGHGIQLSLQEKNKWIIEQTQWLL